MAKLPRPVTTGEFYLEALVEELRALNRNLFGLLVAAEPAEPQGDQVALREPKAATREAKRAQVEVEKAKADADAPVVVETVAVQQPVPNETEPAAKGKK